MTSIEPRTNRLAACAERTTPRFPGTIRTCAVERQRSAGAAAGVARFAAPEPTAPGARAERAVAAVRTKAAGDAFPTQTHWTRILYCDLLSGETGADGGERAAQSVVATIGRHGVVALVVCAGFYLAFTGLVFVLQ